MMKLHWNKKLTVSSLLLICAVAFIIRIVFPHSDVFTEDVVSFTSVDAYYQMRLVDNLVANFPDLTPYDPYFAYPLGNGTGGMHFFVYLLAAIIWIIGLGHPSPELINTVAAYYPAVLGALTIIPVYFIGKLLFNRTAGFLAAGLLAVFGGEFLGRSLLGFTDDHVMEVLLSTLLMLFIILAFKLESKKRFAFIGLALLTFCIFIYTWQGAILFAAIIIISIVLGILLDKIFHRPLNRYLSGIGVAGLIIAIVYLVINPQIVSAINAFLFGSSTMTTQELRPFLMPAGEFDTRIAWGSFTTSFFLTKSYAIPGFGLIALVVILWYVIKNRGEDKPLLLFIIWTIAVLFLTLSFRRFAYYLAVNIAILSGFLISYIIEILLNKKVINLPVMARAVVIFGLLFVAFFWNVGKSVEIAKGEHFEPSKDWQESLQWVKTNTPEPIGSDGEYYNMHGFGETYPDNYGIISWWDYGYWITGIAHRVPFVNPSQNAVAIEKVAKMFLSTVEDNIPGNRYIMLDDEISTSKLWAVITWSGLPLNNYIEVYYIQDGNLYKPVLFYTPDYYRTLMVRLYNFGGQSVEAKPEIIIYELRAISGKYIRVITNKINGLNQEEAQNYIDSFDSNCQLAGSNPFVSPVDIEPVKNYRCIYQNPTIKIFEYIGEMND